MTKKKNVAQAHGKRQPQEPKVKLTKQQVAFDGYYEEDTGNKILSVKEYLENIIQKDIDSLYTVSFYDKVHCDLYGMKRFYEGIEPPIKVSNEEVKTTIERLKAFCEEQLKVLEGIKLDDFKVYVEAKPDASQGYRVPNNPFKAKVELAFVDYDNIIDIYVKK